VETRRTSSNAARNRFVVPQKKRRWITFSEQDTTRDSHRAVSDDIATNVRISGGTRGVQTDRPVRTAKARTTNPLTQINDCNPNQKHDSHPRNRLRHAVVTQVTQVTCVYIYTSKTYICVTEASVPYVTDRLCIDDEVLHKVTRRRPRHAGRSLYRDMRCID